MSANVFHRVRARLGLRRPDFSAEDEALRSLDKSLATLDEAAGQDEPLSSRDPLEYARLAANVARPTRRANVVPLLWSALAGWLVIGLLIAANYFVFRALGENYFYWYLANGTLIGIGFALFSRLLDLDRVPTLISAHPLAYLGAWLQVFSEVSNAWGAVFLPPLPQSARSRSLVLDLILSWLVLLLYGAALLGYLIVVAPLQYWLNLVVAAPARSAMGAPAKPVVEREGNLIVIGWAPAIEPPKKAEDAAVIREEIGFGLRPVTVTSAVSAAILWIVSQFV